MAPSIAEVDAIKTNGAKKKLAKATPNFNNGPANLPKKSPRNPPS